MSAIDLLEEAVHLLRRAPLGGLLRYYSGAAPFVIGLLFFWADMSRSPFASNRLASGALVLAFLFGWMKYWQAEFARTLWNELVPADAGDDTSQPALRKSMLQTVLHSSGFVLLPLAILLSLPFGWVYAFYQNLTVLPAGPNESALDLGRKAWRHAFLWPKQNHITIWLISPILVCLGGILWLVAVPVLASGGSALSAGTAYALALMISALLVFMNPFGMIVAANVAVAILILPEFLRMFLGIESEFTRGGAHIFNSTFFAVVCGVTYLCLDPLIKTVYTLRCFYGESLTSGNDLLVELRAQRDVRGTAVAERGSVERRSVKAGERGSGGASERGSELGNRRAERVSNL